MCAKLIWVCSGSRPQGRFRGRQALGYASLHCRGGLVPLLRAAGNCAAGILRDCHAQSQQRDFRETRHPAFARGEYLRSSIMEGRMKGGERLREQELCEQLGISRSTLREALHTGAERLISIEPHRGPTVIRITEKAAQDLYALRALLEGFAAHEFARLASDADIDRLKKAVDALHRQAKGGTKPALLAAKHNFYEVLLAGCGNDLVRTCCRDCCRASTCCAPRPSRSRTGCPSMAEIDLLFERIRSRDPEGAQAAARTTLSMPNAPRWTCCGASKRRLPEMTGIVRKLEQAARAARQDSEFAAAVREPMRHPFAGAGPGTQRYHRLVGRGPRRRTGRLPAGVAGYLGTPGRAGSGARLSLVHGGAPPRACACWARICA